MLSIGFARGQAVGDPCRRQHEVHDYEQRPWRKTKCYHVSSGSDETSVFLGELLAKLVWEIYVYSEIVYINEPLDPRFYESFEFETPRVLGFHESSNPFNLRYIMILLKALLVPKYSYAFDNTNFRCTELFSTNFPRYVLSRHLEFSIQI